MHEMQIVHSSFEINHRMVTRRTLIENTCVFTVGYRKWNPTLQVLAFLDCLIYGAAEFQFLRVDATFDGPNVIIMLKPVSWVSLCSERKKGNLEG